MNVLDLLKRLYRALPEPPSTNYRLPRRYPNPFDLLPPKATIYDIGAKDARARYFGAPPRDATVVCLDIAPGPYVDIIADAQDMPQIPSESADCVLLVSVLQHIPAPQKALSEALRVLRPGGILYVNVPFIFVYHRDPEDYYRFTVRGLAEACSAFELIASGSNRGPASTFCDLLVRFFAILFCFNSNALYAALVYTGKWTLFWIKYLDVFLARYSMAYLLAGSPFFLGRKAREPGISTPTSLRND